MGGQCSRAARSPCPLEHHTARWYHTHVRPWRVVAPRSWNRPRPWPNPYMRTRRCPSLHAPRPHTTTATVTSARTEAGAGCGLVVVREPVLGLRALRASYFAALADAGLAVAMNLPGPLLDDHELVVARMLAGLPAADQEALLDPLRPI